MTNMIVIDPIDATHEGPNVPLPGSEDEYQLLHLRQGDIDGACGPYCLFMALMICGVSRRDEITGPAQKIHGNSNLARTFKLMQEYTAFFRHGTGLHDLVAFVNTTYRSKVTAVPCPERGVALRSFIERHILLNNPVIIGLDWGETTGHWVLVVGLEYLEDGTLWRLLVLDPSAAPSKVCAWNSVIEANGSGGIFPYLWWNNEDMKVQFSEGMALMKI